MRRSRIAGQFVRSAAAWLLAVVLSPLAVVAGEWLRRYVLARPVARQAQRSWHRVPRRLFDRPRRVPGPWRGRQFVVLLVTSPLWIALTAPTRWLLGWAAVWGGGGAVLQMLGCESRGGRSRACPSVRSLWQSLARRQSLPACSGRSRPGHVTKVIARGLGARAAGGGRAVADEGL